MADLSEKKIILTINSIYKETVSDTGEKIGLTVPGLAIYHEGKLRKLIYEEKDLETRKKSEVEILINNYRISMNKKGEDSAKMIFDLQRKTTGQYITPFGHIEMNIITTNLKTRSSELKGEINLEYFINFKNNYKTINQLLIKYYIDIKMI